MACFSLAPFPDFPLGIHLMWCNKWRALGMHRMFHAFLRNPEHVGLLMIRYLSTCSWASFYRIKFLMPSCCCFCRIMACRSAPAHLHGAPLGGLQSFFALLQDVCLLLFNPSPLKVFVFLLQSFCQNHASTFNRFCTTLRLYKVSRRSKYFLLLLLQWARSV